MTVARGSFAGSERLEWLSERLDREGAVTISDAADVLAVSEMTIRRDLDELESRGTARRVRGGAKAVGPATFAERHDLAAGAKAKIAAKLSDLLPSSGVVAFDASSTVLRLAAHLADARDLQVLTNGPDTFAAMQNRPGVASLLTGGRLDPRTGSFVGPLACRTAEALAPDRFFCSAAAVSVDIGPMEATLEDAEVKRAMARSAGEVVLAVDSSKLGGRAPASSLEWSRVDRLVTELDPDDERLAEYRDLVEVC